MYLHRLYYLNGVQNIDSVVKPRIEITAIGRGVIEGTIGNLYSSKVNMDHKRMTELKSLSIAGSRTEIEDLRMTIVPVLRDSKIEINYSIVYEFTTYNAGFVISRTVGGIETLFTPGGNDGVNDMTFICLYESDYSSTAQSSCYSMIDEPGTTDTVVYKIYGKSVDGTAITLHLNRSGTVTTTNGYETGISHSSVKELPQQTTLHNPRYNSVIEQEGQVLETLAGVCDGRSVSVSSGTYILPNVTAVFEPSDGSSYVDLPNSSFSYKPPPGTSQVIYRYKINIAGNDTHGIANFKLYVDDTEVTKFVRSWTGKGPDEDTLILDYTFEIGKTNDIANAKFLTWNTLKTIKIKVREHTASGHEVKFYSRGYWEGSYQYGSDGFVQPSLEIVAIGRKSDTTFLNSFFNERKGQVLETLAGICDGRTIEVDSGTYTLTNVSSTQNATTSWADVTGSSISYTPPSGTKQVVFEFHTGLSTDTDIGTVNYDGQGRFG